MKSLPWTATLRARQNFFLSFLPMWQVVATTGAHTLQDTIFLAFNSITAMQYSIIHWKLLVKALGCTTLQSEFEGCSSRAALFQQIDKIMSMVQSQHWSSHETIGLWTSITLNFSAKVIFCFKQFQHLIKHWLDINIKGVDIFKKCHCNCVNLHSKLIQLSKREQTVA